MGTDTMNSNNTGVIEKVPTGLKGLDDVLRGGIPRGSLTLLSGGPGTGKTLIGMEILVRNALAGTPGVILTFEERDTALRRYAGGFGWDLTDLEENGMLAIISAVFSRKPFSPVPSISGVRQYWRTE